MTVPIPQDEIARLGAKLQQRGIADVARLAGWRPHRRNHQSGWLYPVYDFDGEVIATRWKAFDSSAKPKYLWPNRNPKTYYMMPGGGLRQAVADNGGVLYIANGEVGVLTFAAAGLPALSWFGEQNVPKTLADDLRALDVHRVIYAVDRDDAGCTSGAKVLAMLTDSGIDVEILQMPDYIQDKGDTNDLWQALSFDQQAFVAALERLDPAALPSPPAASPAHARSERRKKADTSGLAVPWEEERARWIDDEVMQRLDSAAPLVRGKYRRCPNPHHDDSDPSFRISYEKIGHGFPQCSCDIQHQPGAWNQVAEWVGARSFVEWFKEERGSLYLKERHRPAPAALDELQADLVVNTRYISLPTDRPQTCLAVQSEVNTGKTTAAIQAMAKADKALFLSHRMLLAENIGQAAASAGVTVEFYKSLNLKDMRRVSRLAICVNTLVHMAKAEGGLPDQVDLVVIDEFVQLLGHIASGETFEKGDALLAFEAVKFLLQKARRVYVMDAHMTEDALALLRQLRGADDVLFMRNTYHPDAGALVMHETADGALAVGLELLDRDEGPVVFPMASRNEARDLSTLLVHHLGSTDNVLLLTAENAGGERQRRFLQSPNTETAQYRAIVHSPVLGTGYDITAPVRAVVARLGGPHIAATDARQMIGRFRTAREVHVWLPAGGAGREEDVGTLYEREIRKAAGTQKVLNERGQAVPDVSARLKGFNRLQATIKARHNRSLNRLRAHFQALCQGYSVSWSDGVDAAIKAQLQAIREARTETLKRLALTVEPVDRDAYDLCLEAGEVTDEIEAGYRRGLIEGVGGVSIDVKNRDLLWSERSRRALIAFTDLKDDEAQLELADMREIEQGKPLHMRQHRLERARIRAAFLDALISPGLDPIEYTKEAFEATLGPIVAAHWEAITTYFASDRPDRLKTVAGIVRLILRSMGPKGLKLCSEQRTVKGEHVQFYCLDDAAFTAWFCLACQRMRMLRLQRAEKAISSNLKSANGLYETSIGSFQIDPRGRLKRLSTAPARRGRRGSPPVNHQEARV